MSNKDQAIRDLKEVSLKKWQRIEAMMVEAADLTLTHDDCGYCEIYYVESAFGNHNGSCAGCPLYRPELCELGEGVGYECAYAFKQTAGRHLTGVRQMISAIREDIMRDEQSTKPECYEQPTDS